MDLATEARQNCWYRSSGLGSIIAPGMVAFLLIHIFERPGVLILTTSINLVYQLLSANGLHPRLVPLELPILHRP
jgi:hypothetical protein